MKAQKPVRDQDTILIRVPDGMKDQVAQRAAANGRSMSAEIVSILTELFEFPDELAIRSLISQQETLKAEEKRLKKELDDCQKRLIAVMKELSDRWDASQKAYREKDLDLGKR
ncbi:Arc family DNA-binding protein [Novosphingobium capsulatum]|uniref:Arc family DNA-binding protein n=1 Tax=Novosphingobium capsulatum TaxID=13688 RepID=UPI0009FC75F6|nr:Arc family DNA-binding protein [Novosphingobium capsulatum]WQD92772.1 Arc family DNA-binding protein [Novosphingobium capsulatum]